MNLNDSACLRGTLGRVLGLLVILFCAALQPATAAGVRDLRCEYLANPLGIHESAPRLSWRMVS